MELSANLKEKGFKLCDVEASDFAVYYEISRACYEGYVNAFFGGWDEARQIEMNRDAFQSERNETCFQKSCCMAPPWAFSRLTCRTIKSTAL